MPSVRRMPDSVRKELMGTASEYDGPAGVRFRPVVAVQEQLPQPKPTEDRGRPTREDLMTAEAANKPVHVVAAEWGLKPHQVSYLRQRYGLTRPDRGRGSRDAAATLAAIDMPAVAPAPEAALASMTITEHGTYTADYLRRYLGGLSVLFERLADGEGEFEFEIRIRRVAKS